VGEAVLNLEMALDILSRAGFDPLLLDERTGSRPLLEYVIRERLMAKHAVWLRKLLLRTEPPTELAETTRDEPGPATLELSALGSSVVRRNGKAVEASELRLGAKRMLFFFLAHPVATKEQIVAALWPDLSVAKAHSTFHFYLFQVRRVLGGADAITYRGGAYRLESRVHVYDVEEFQRALAKAEKARGSERERYLREAVSLYQGDYLEDVYADWTTSLRVSLQRQYSRAVEELAGHYHQGGRTEEAVKCYRNLLDRDPLREDIHRQVIRGLALMGDHAAAIRQYEELRRTLAEFGAEPSKETLELYEDLLTGAD
jgi:DNA-binding SARP family transcriptional activator